MKWVGSWEAEGKRPLGRSSIRLGELY